MTDRRKNPRFVIRLEGDLIRPSRQAVQVRSRDLSLCGAGIALPVDVEVGEQVVLKFAWPAERRALTQLEVSGEVVRVDRAEGRRSQAAICFSHFPRLSFRSGWKEGRYGRSAPALADPVQALSPGSPFQKARIDFPTPRGSSGAAVERAYFSSLFRQRAGISFTEWLLRYRGFVMAPENPR